MSSTMIMKLILLIMMCRMGLMSDERVHICDKESVLLNQGPTQIFFGGSVLKGGGCMFPRRLVLVGSQGAGKSSLANSLLGWDKTSTDPVPFDIGHGIQAGTHNISYASGAWLGRSGSPGVTVMDTPGFNSSMQQLEDLVWILAEMEEVSAYLLVFRYRDRFSGEILSSIKTVDRLLGSIWNNLAIVVSFWSFSDIGKQERKSRRINEKKYNEQIHRMLLNKLRLDNPPPIFYIDSHFDPDSPTEVRHYKKETAKLWEFIQDTPTWRSLPPGELHELVRKVKMRSGELKERCQMIEDDQTEWRNIFEERKNIIRSQNRNIQDYRDTIEKLKRSCL